MKILFIIDYITYGGAPKMIADLANAMAGYHHECFLYSYCIDLKPNNLNEGVTYIGGQRIKNIPILGHLLKYKDICKTTKKVNPDLVVAFSSYPSLLSIIMGARMHYPVVFSERADPYIYSFFIQFVQKVLFSKAYGAVFQTEGARSYYKKYELYNNSVVIPNAVTLCKSERIPFEKRKKEIAFVGRFYLPQKRQDVAVKAFQLFLLKHPDYKLVFYGDGKDLDKIKKQVKKSGIDNNVVFMGAVKNLAECLKNSKMLLITSDYEGIPNALIEGMCIGLPCISTDCSPGGARFLIQDKENGLLVPRNSPNDIAEACSFIVEHPDIAEQYGKDAQMITEKLSPQIIYQLWNDYLTSKIKSKNPSRI